MNLRDPITYLSLMVFLPALGALILAFMPRGKDEAIKFFTLAVTIFTFMLTLGLFLDNNRGVEFDAELATMQNMFSAPWIPSFGIQYLMGLDGISFPLIVLTAFLCVLAMAASWPITKHVKAYCMLFLLLETGMIGVFLALDFFLFYVFWEVMLLPMYFLIGVWGGPRKEYAAIKFFLYTLVGSVLMLIAILMLYFNSDLTLLSPQQLVDAGVVPVAAPRGQTEQSAEEAFNAWLQSDDPIAQRYKEVQAETDPSKRRQLHTFNILAMQQMGQLDDSPFDNEAWLQQSIQWWAFLLLFVGFIIKVPSVPLHTWLPDAHVEAPTPISMILAGILLKMGGYGIIRICYPICPAAGYDLAYFVCLVGVVSMVWGAFAAMAQNDFKRLVAYSSVSHMGYVVLGLGVWSLGQWTVGDSGSLSYNADYWKMGVNGAMFQMIAHGISSAGMFFCVGVLYDRVHHRNLNEFGGIFGKMPVYSGLAIAIFFAGLGLPGLCGFIGEVFVVLSVWKYSQALAIISAAVVILTAGYILWAIQRVYLGAEYRGPHGEWLTPITMREVAIAVPMVVFAIILGVYPQSLLNYMQPTVDRQVDTLAAWTEKNDAQREALRKSFEEEEKHVAAAATP